MLTSISEHRHADAAHDIAGVGFGPSNLALAVAVSEHNAAPQLSPMSAVFLERRSSFAWHPGMLLRDATMQVSFLKDLVTLRNPRSPYTFLNYLHERRRISAFINQKDFFPTRLEFHDYLSWAAESFGDAIKYGYEVELVEPVVEGGEVIAFDIAPGDGSDPCHGRVRARNLVIASGLRPRLPAGISSSDRVWHSAELLPRLESWEGPDPQRVAVVGAGQSAAEVLAFLHDRFPACEIYSVVQRYGFVPSDDSPFANQIFDPEAVDFFFEAGPDFRARLLDDHANTNYSVVDQDLITDLYRRMYREQVAGQRRLHVLKGSRIVGAALDPSGHPHLEVLNLSDSRTKTLPTDLAVFATGYEHMDPIPLLGKVAHLCRLDDQGRVLVDRDYRVQTAPEVIAGIYLQGGTEHVHGLSSSLLSNLATRAAEIVGSVDRDLNGSAFDASARRTWSEERHVRP